MVVLYNGTILYLLLTLEGPLHDFIYLTLGEKIADIVKQVILRLWFPFKILC